MSYNQVPTFVNNERFSVDEANLYIRDNLNALKTPPTAFYVTIGHANDYSTTSTSFIDIDGTNLALTITTTGNGAGGNGDVLIAACGTVYSSASIRIYFRILEDGISLNGDDGLIELDGSGVRAFAINFLKVNTPPGIHTYKLQWKVSSGTGVLMANAGTSTRNTQTIFFVRELS